MEWIASGIFSLIIGGVGLWTALSHLKSRTELNKWKTTKGRVIERGVFQSKASNLGPPAFQNSPLVKYRYEIDGREFVSNCIHPARLQLPPRGKRKWAEKKAASFPEEVLVHYNSSDPSEAYLIQTSRSMLVGVATICFLVILFGLLILASLRA